jgi:transposase
MITEHRNPRVLAQLAHTCMRANLNFRTETLTGHFHNHHARFWPPHARPHRRTQIQVLIAPFATCVTQLDEIPGVGVIGAEELITKL